MYVAIRSCEKGSWQRRDLKCAGVKWSINGFVLDRAVALVYEFSHVVSLMFKYQTWPRDPFHCHSMVSD